MGFNKYHKFNKAFIFRESWSGETDDKLNWAKINSIVVLLGKLAPRQCGFQSCEVSVRGKSSHRSVFSENIKTTP